MLGAEAPSDDDRRNELQRAPADDFRDANRGQVTGQTVFDHPVLGEHLTGLDDSGRQFPAALHLREIGVGRRLSRSGAQRTFAAATASATARLMPPRRLVTWRARHRQCTAGRYATMS